MTSGVWPMSWPFATTVAPLGALVIFTLPLATTLLSGIVAVISLWAGAVVAELEIGGAIGLVVRAFGCCTATAVWVGDGADVIWRTCRLVNSHQPRNPRPTSAIAIKAIAAREPERTSRDSSLWFQS